VKADYFESGEDFRGWLERHHDKEAELWVGFYKVSSGKSGLTYKQSVDQALCFGWIDGLRQSIDAERYRIRFTPRKPKSIWSKVNLKRFDELREQQTVASPGQKAFESRDPAMANKYSFENEEQEFDGAMEARFRANHSAWKFFTGEAKSYQKVAKWWVVSAKREETRTRRLEALIEVSEAGKRLDHLSKWKSKAT